MRKRASLATTGLQAVATSDALEAEPMSGQGKSHEEGFRDPERLLKVESEGEPVEVRLIPEDGPVPSATAEEDQQAGNLIGKVHEGQWQQDGEGKSLQVLSGL